MSHVEFAGDSECSVLNSWLVAVLVKYLGASTGIYWNHVLRSLFDLQLNV